MTALVALGCLSLPAFTAGVRATQSSDEKIDAIQRLIVAGFPRLRTDAASRVRVSLDAGLASQWTDGIWLYVQVFPKDFKGPPVDPKNPSDADLAGALTGAGGKYGPDRREAFLDDLHIERFVPVFGRIEKTDVQFKWRLGRPSLGSGDVMTRT